MTAPASVQKAARAAVFSVASAAVTADGVHTFGVFYDVPPAASTPDDVVAVGRVERVPAPFAMVGSLGAGAMHEEVTVHVVVEVFRGGYDPLGVYERACDLVYAVEGAVRNDPTLGGAVYLARPSQGAYSCEPDPDHKGLIGTYELAITCKAVI